MKTLFVLLVSLVLFVILFIILEMTGIFKIINHEIALLIGATSSYLFGRLGWKIVEIYQKRQKLKKAV